MLEYLKQPVINILIFIKSIPDIWYLFFYNLIEALQPKMKRDLLIFYDINEKNTELIDALCLFEKASEQGLNCCYIAAKNHPRYKELKSRFPEKIITLNKIVSFNNMHIFHFFKFLKLHSFLTSFGVSIIHPLTKSFLVNNKYINFIFIQHGVILLKSSILEIYNRKSFNKILVNNPIEAEIAKKYMHYRDNDLIKAALPRFDLLENKLKTNSIFVFFTWRLSFKSISIENTIYKKKLLSFLGNERLHAALKRHNTKLKVSLHHCVLEYAPDFNLGENIEIVDTKKVSECIKNSDMLVTDYSSIWSDFFYLNKPVVFYRLDDDDKSLLELDIKDREFAKEKDDLLYNVAYDEDKAVALVEKYIDCNFTAEDEYKKIQNSFFYTKENIREKILGDVLNV